MSTFSALGTREDSVISGSGTLGTPYFDITRSRESITGSQ